MYTDNRMNQTDYTDYHQLRWSIPRVRLTKTQFIISRLFYIIPYCILATIVSSKLSVQQTIVVRQELLWVYMGLAFALLSIIVSLDFVMSVSVGPAIDDYQLSKIGLQINKKTITLQKLSSSQIDLMIKSPSRYVKQQSNFYEVTLPLQRRSTLLRLPNQTTVNKLFSSLHHYLKL